MNILYNNDYIIMHNKCYCHTASYTSIIKYVHILIHYLS